jgi:hypothetical protein
MRTLLLPLPPEPPSTSGWARDAYQWMVSVKGALEELSRINDSPLGQQFVVGSFTTNTTIAGTTTGTDLSNFVASFIEAMTAKGLVSPTISRQGVV